MEKEEKKRFSEIDSLRGLAATMVAIFHFDIYNSLTSQNIVMQSWLFVDFFFVLSGFIISYNYKNSFLNKNDFKRFIILRIGRLFPLHLFMLLLFIVLEIGFSYVKKMGFLSGYAVFSEGKMLVGLLYEFSMMHALPFSIDTSWNPPSWSISVELYVYLIFSVVVIFFGKKLNALVKLFLIALSFYLIFQSELGIESSHDFALARCIYGFFVGVFLSDLYDFFTGKENIFNYIFINIIELSFFLGMLSYLYFASTKNIQLFAPFVFALFVIPFLYGKGWVSQIFRMRFFQFLGELSYSIYMVHIFVFLVVNFLLKSFFQGYYDRLDNLYIINYFSDNYLNIMVGNVVLLLSLIVVLIFSLIVYSVIEKPGRSYARKVVREYYPARKAER